MKKFFKAMIVTFLFLMVAPNAVKAEEAQKYTVTITVNRTVNNAATPVANTSVMISQGNETITYGTTNKEGIFTFELENGDYTLVAGNTQNQKSYYDIKDFTVKGSNISVTATLDYLLTPNAATTIYNRTSYFNHVDIRVNGTFTTGTQNNLVTHTIKLKNVSLTVTDNGVNVFNPVTFTNHNETYEWRVTGKRVPKTAVVSLTFDIVLDGVTVKEGYTYSFSGQEDFEQAIINCDQNQGLDFIMDPVEIIEEALYDVNYEWKVRYPDNTYGAFPNMLATPPAEQNGYSSTNPTHTVDTTWEVGEVIVDEQTNLMYTFEGWTTWSNEQMASGVTESLTGTTLSITSDTKIYGVWTITDLSLVEKDVESHIVIKKQFSGNDNRLPLNLYFKVTDANIDANNPYIVEISLSSFTYSGGVYTYRLPIYGKQVGNQAIEYNYTIEELNYIIPGYTFNSSSSSSTIQTVTTDFATEKEVLFSNVYTKNIGTDFHNSGFIIEKTDTKYEETLEGAVFTLTNGGNVITSLPTDESGYTMFYNLAAGTYTLKETVAPNGYLLDNTEYTVVVTLVDSYEVYSATQNAYVTQYNYSIEITPDEHYNSNALGSNTNRLTVFNQKAGSITISKEFASNSEFNKDNFEGTIVVDITGDNYNNSVVLNKANNWTVTLNNLNLGKYTITENISRATIPGYDLTVNYDNGLEYIIVEVNADTLDHSLVITNTYTETITYTEVSVEKVWKGKDDNSYPTEIEVGLYKDGILEDVQILSSTNNWSYTWTNLVDEYEWSVDEITKLNDYTKTVTSANNHFIITNEYTAVEEDKNDIPQTGKESNIYLYLITMVIGLIGFISTTLKFKNN